MSYYRFIIGSGFYQCYQYVVKTEYPTTDYEALTDMLIDYLVAKGSRNILDMENEYEFGEDGMIYRKSDGWETYPDEYVEGGNCGNVLMHYGTFYVEEISENEINEYDELIKETEIC